MRTAGSANAGTPQHTGLNAARLDTSMERCTTHPAFDSSDRGQVTRTARDLPPPPEGRSLPSPDGIAALRELVPQGFTRTEAGNLAAYLLGLAHTNDGWTIDEIERLLFVRHLAARQHIRS